jgi:phage-related protein
VKNILLDDVYAFLDNIPNEKSGKILKQLKFLEVNDVEGLKIKTLKDKIKELIVDQYRVVFFVKEETVYVIDAFKKQSQKTPHRILERALGIYRKLQ